MTLDRANRGAYDEFVELLELCRAIADGNAKRALHALTAEPVLATAALTRGATRADPAPYRLGPMEHYVYAGDTALHVAAFAYAPAIVRALLRRGANPNAVNRRDATPLHYAADGQPGSAWWNPRAQAATIRALIGAGAEVDAGPVTALYRAIRTRSASAVAALLAAGAQVDAKARRLAVTTTGRGGSGSPAARAEQQRIVRLLAEA